MPQDPVAFLSYARFDDEHENGRLTQFREQLSREVRLHSGKTFTIFQDRNDIAWGEQWKPRIEGALQSVTFFIPVLTPSFFASPACREELELFLAHEARLQRNDLILPLYYLDCPRLASKDPQAADPLARALAERQFFDWREYRFEPFTAPEVGKSFAQMARQILAALERAQPAGGNARNPSRSEAPSGKVLIVDPLHRGDFPTLGAAIQAAKPGSRILVRPGLYRESLVIDKPLEIMGDGNRDDIVIEASDKNAVLFQADMGRIVNLTLRQIGGQILHCVDIAQGRLHLEDCDISSLSGCCVVIHHGADPRLRRNRIHDGKSAGVFVYENGQGILEDNEIFANALAGVAISSGGNPTLRRNRIHDGKSAGVFVYDNGQVILEDNEIFANALAGVQIKSGGNPTLKRNRIHDGKSAGVFVNENGQGILEDNEIFANTLSGVEIKSGGNPTLRRNRIHDGKSGGVLVWENGQGILEDNEIFANTLSGVEIKSGGNPTLRHNRIHDGKSAGVFVHENGQGILEDNEIFANTLSGVDIRNGGYATLLRNRISGNKQYGIVIVENGGGRIEANDLRNSNKAWNIDSSCKANINLEGNID